MTTDFLADFRLYQQQFRYSLNKYAFALIDLDNEPMFYHLTSFNLGRFDSPSIFAIGDIDRKVYYRNYHTYYAAGTDFKHISDTFVREINNGTKLPLYAKWQDCPHNLWNLEYWVNNKMKAYIYIIGLISIIVLPFIILVDCFFPLLGRGPNSQRKKSKQE